MRNLSWTQQKCVGRVTVAITRPVPQRDECIAAINEFFLSSPDVIVSFDDPVSMLPLSSRVINMLEREGIQKISQLANLTPAELLAFRQFGETCLEEVRSAVELAAKKLHGGSSDEDDDGDCF